MSLFDQLTLAFNQKALLAAALIGFSNGYLGGYIVLRKSALMVGSLAHSLLPGLAVAILIFGVLNATTGFIGALAAALAIGLGSIAISRRSGLDGNSTLGILYPASFAAGLIMLDHVQQAGELEHWLFGNILGLADSDLWTAWGISALVILVLLALQRPLLVTLFNSSVAASQGIRVALLDYVLMGLTVLALINSLQSVGCILSLGLMIAPASTVYLFVTSPRGLFWGGGILGATISCSAVVLSNMLDIRTGALIVTVLGSVFLVAFFTKQLPFRKR
ncbi:MAG: metal ABC transporter permease [Verrucomicrobiota bacterium]